jgi:hypothetical protein
MQYQQSLRNLYRSLGFLGGLFVGLFVCLAQQTAWSEESVATRPNIVLIVSDDQAWTDYGFMGHPHLKTPHLDRLAADSLTFRRGYVPSSLCCPSLATILTGRYPHDHKITSNDPPTVTGLSGKAFQESEAVSYTHLTLPTT